MVYIDSLIVYLPHVRIDIEGEIVKFNRKELDNKSRKNIARDLRSLIPRLSYRFGGGIELRNDEKLVITILDDNICKNSYKNVKLSYNIIHGEEVCYLKEGYRYLSLEEMHRIINLIHEPEKTIIYLDVDLCTY